MSQRSITLRRPQVASDELAWFRFGRIGQRVVITNDVGDWELLDEPEFEDLLGGRIDEEHPRHAVLQAKGFIRNDLDVAGLASRLRRKKRFLGQGPHLGIIITTLRCNQNCRYCHASRTEMDRVDTDMSLETAKKVVDHIMQTPSPYLNIEFQGGEPTVAFESLKFIVEYSREKNRYENKRLEHSLVTNMTTMTEEMAEWLVRNNVMVCTSLDGPAEVHNYNRTWQKGSNAYDSVIHWIEWFNNRYIELGRDPRLWHVDALMTTTRKTIDHWKEVIDLYVSLGIKNIHLRPLNPFGFAMSTWKRIGYSPEEYLEFYTNCLEYILELNRQGVEISEGTASVFLMKMLTPDDPNFVDIRSPVGSGTGQLAYMYDGSIHASDEARMIAAMGDDLFDLGHVDNTTFDEAVNHPTVKAIAVASILDSLPMCADCWNAPFCGVRPLHNYMLQKDLFAQRARTPKCAEHMGIARFLLSKLDGDEDGSVERIFRRWTISRPRDPEEGLDAAPPVRDPSSVESGGPTSGHSRLPVLE
ncbi:MAG: His-Xaa-Ser system radical SAM maturase HxsB [Deltaproteobacteria bacterium]|nr:His-Xaa-Ser system radical SAM maturase HxsB [Deltaproteobacteria bacterium]